jgi:hypothetical protein
MDASQAIMNGVNMFTGVPASAQQNSSGGGQSWFASNWQNLFLTAGMMFTNIWGAVKGNQPQNNWDPRNWGNSSGAPVGINFPPILVIGVILYFVVKMIRR